jgi:hypothetical protein
MNSTECHWITRSGTIRLLPERGRLLGIEVHGHQALWQPASVDAQWNLGGERLWLGPESDWFWQQTAKVDFSKYRVPPGLDPDGWSVSLATADHAVAELRLRLESAHSGHWLDLRVRREWRILTDDSPDGFAHAIGLRATTSLEILDGTPGQAVDLWSILQIPHGGEMRMPTHGLALPRDYFDPCPVEEMTAGEGDFALRIGGAAVFKIGIPPASCAGRLAYVRPVDGGWLVLTRSFPVDAGRRYCDAPLDALASQGDAAQFFNDGGQYGCFGELEHHSPALVCGDGPQQYAETTTTIASFLTPAEFDAWHRHPWGKPSGVRALA